MQNESKIHCRDLLGREDHLFAVGQLRWVAVLTRHVLRRLSGWELGLAQVTKIPSQSHRLTCNITHDVIPQISTRFYRVKLFCLYIFNCALCVKIYFNYHRRNKHNKIIKTMKNKSTSKVCQKFKS